MADAPATKRFFANGAKIFATKQSSTLATFARAAGFAAVVTTIAPDTAGNSDVHKTQSADIAAIDAINRAVSFSPLLGIPNLSLQKAANTRTASVKAEDARYNLDVTTVLNAVTKQRLDNLSAVNIYHQYGDYKIPRNVLKGLVQAAKDADFPADYLFGIVEKESGFDCQAVPPSGSARGCMQVIDQTWLRLVKEYGPRYGLNDEAGLVQLTTNKRKQPVYKVSDKAAARRILDLRYDPYYAAVLSITDLKSAKLKIEKNLAARFNDDNLYLPHFMGEDRAEAALAAYETRPNASASRIFNREAKANPGMFYEGKGRRRVPIDVAGFIKRAQNVILSRSAKYHDVEQIAKKDALDFVATGSIPVPLEKPTINKDSFVSAMKARIANRKITLEKSVVAPLPPGLLEADLITAEYARPKL